MSVVNFKVGDKVKYVNRSGRPLHGLIAGEVYTISRSYTGLFGDALVNVEGLEHGFLSTKFELVESVDSSCEPDPDQPFPYPEDDDAREAKAREMLRKYKKSMRNYLYGTSDDVV